MLKQWMTATEISSDGPDDAGPVRAGFRRGAASCRPRAPVALGRRGRLRLAHPRDAGAAAGGAERAAQPADRPGRPQERARARGRGHPVNPLRLTALIQRTGRVAEPAPPIPTDELEPTAALPEGSATEPAANAT